MTGAEAVRWIESWVRDGYAPEHLAEYEAALRWMVGRLDAMLGREWRKMGPETLERSGAAILALSETIKPGSGLFEGPGDASLPQNGERPASTAKLGALVTPDNLDGCASGGRRVRRVDPAGVACVHHVPETPEAICLAADHAAKLGGRLRPADLRVFNVHDAENVAEAAHEADTTREGAKSARYRIRYEARALDAEIEAQSR